ncbi:CoA ester lyase [Citricoccus zhacaiensis]|uniref:CoA ester lyase n=1 Tax=Citricoccus zhacaiensis TaxID=489142 RepID=A0ABQ2M506_9MICC|nr:CoA ester lyase [Citricoccus zhacaiensis]
MAPDLRTGIEVNDDVRRQGLADTTAVAWPASWLYVPASKPSLFTKAAGSDAEALILDLEDSVPHPDKRQARRELTAWLTANAVDADGGPRGSVHGKPVWVRINAEHVTEDAAAVMGPESEALCAGVILAKAEPAVVAELEDITGGRLPVIGLVESATGLKGLDRMAASPSVVTFGIGEVDLLADLRMRRSPAAEAAVDALRLQVVVSCASAGLRAPLAPTSTDFRDLGAFAESTRKFQDLGFRARTAIHPGQCPVINSVFTPTAEDVTAARRIMDHSAQASGGVTLDDSGRLIDAAVVRGALETLERATANRELPDTTALPAQSPFSSRRRN